MIADAENWSRNDRLNYYKFNLGLGAASSLPALNMAKGDRKAVEIGGLEASAGGADQSVPRNSPWVRTGS